VAAKLLEKRLLRHGAKTDNTSGRHWLATKTDADLRCVCYCWLCCRHNCQVSVAGVE